MTLSRQLVLLVAALLVLVFAGTFLISAQNGRDYLEAQLGSHAQDAATSLGLSISPHMAENDLVTVAAMVDAIFDRGYYRQVRIEGMTGEALVERELPLRIEGVPAWFIEALPLDTPQGEAMVMAGWQQAGVVRVRSHPGYAYRQLWDNVTATAGWFLLSALVVSLLGVMALRLVLRPLKQVQWQAESICNREFPVLEKMPRTLDLRRIVEAMNRMSRKVQRMLSEQEELAARLHQKAYQNSVTGLANREHFMGNMEYRMTSTEVFARGLLCLIQLRGLKAYNEEHGYAAGNELLQLVARLLREIALDIPRHTLAHLAGGDFVLVAEDQAYADGPALGERLAHGLAGLYGSGRLKEPDVGHVGIAFYDGSQNLSQLLAEADLALRHAQSQGPNGWYLAPLRTGRPAAACGASDWHGVIERALAEDRLVLQLQPVYACADKSILHHEVLVRIAGEDGNLLTAGVFMPMAESLGLTAAIDRAVIARALRRLTEDAAGASRLAVNIAPPSLQAEGFLDWLEQTLRQHAAVAGRLIFELPEYGAVAMLDAVRELIRRSGHFGCMVSLDHFGRGFSSFAYLHSLKVHYLKVDGSYLHQLGENPDHQFFIQALTDIAHGLEMTVIVEAVESEAVWTLLPTLHVDGAQGYHLGRPA